MRLDKPSLDAKSAMVCSQAGIDLMNKQAIDLRKTIKVLEGQIQDIEKHKTKQERLAGVGLTLNLLKATSEAFVDLGMALTGAKNPVLASLKKLRPVASEAGNVLAGKGLTKDSAKAAIGYAKGGKDNFEKCMSDFAANTTNLMIDAMANDTYGVKKAGAKSVIAANKCALAAGEVMKERSRKGAGELWGKASDKVGRVTDFAFAIEKYNHDLEKAFDTYLSDIEGAGGTESAKKTVKAGLQKQIDNLRKLEAAVADCAGK
ncbi:hypothetical protein A6F68_00879 [Tsuneonella dongtanensis]|uniref:Uncharacterized protein n=1 Tax=Tsuneonella dongtanensis TaxID=692370 RepID=A0A1B2ABI5_9SPHN|nr:hypothetical protein [Tsuneonella dongtanensis]ANY19405.1 hypothetical protein A6F68_00879 [Tsuneonella dongtanensis]